MIKAMDNTRALRLLVRTVLVAEGRHTDDDDSLEALAGMPEYASVEDFVDSLEDDAFSHLDLQALAQRRHGVRSPSQPQLRALRAELESYGLRLLAREPAKDVRGVTSSLNGRHPFAGSGGGGTGFSTGWGSGGFTSYGGGPGAIGGGYDWDPNDKKNLSMGSRRRA